MEDQERMLNEMSLQELEYAEYLTDNLLKLIRQKYEHTTRRLFNNNIYVELLFFKKEIEKELI